jgi:hypothetical protein
MRYKILSETKYFEPRLLVFCGKAGPLGSAFFL